MSYKQIPNMTQIISVTTDTLLEGVQGGSSGKLSVGQIAEFVVNDFVLNTTKSFQSRNLLKIYIERFGAVVGYTYFDGVGIYSAPSGGSSDISDLPGLSFPTGEYIPDWSQFTNIAEARSWSLTNNRFYRNTDGNFLIGKYESGHNAGFTNAAFCVSINLSDVTVQNKIGFASELNVTDPNATGDFIGSSGSVIVDVDPGPGTATGGIGVNGRAITLASNADVRGGYFSALLPNNNDGTIKPGNMYGFEAKIRNNNGWDISDPRDDAEHSTANMFLVGADNSEAPDLLPITAAIMLGTYDEGWYNGLWLRNIRENYIFMEDPLWSSARAISLENGSNWAEQTIVLPYNKGIGSWDVSGTTALTMSLFNGVQFDLYENTRVLSRLGVATFETESTVSGSNLLHNFNAPNSAAASKTAARITASLPTNTAGAENGSWQISTLVTGTQTVQLRTRAGVMVGAPTGSEKGTGTINIQNGLYIDGTLVFGAGGGYIAPSFTTAQFADKTNAVNTANKITNKIVRNSTTGSLYIANGTADVSTWSVYNVDATVTPA